MRQQEQLGDSPNYRLIFLGFYLAALNKTHAAEEENYSGNSHYRKASSALSR
jgi:hypothetical protein